MLTILRKAIPYLSGNYKLCIFDQSAAPILYDEVVNARCQRVSVESKVVQTRLRLSVQQFPDYQAPVIHHREFEFCCFFYFKFYIQTPVRDRVWKNDKAVERVIFFRYPGG